MPRQKKPAKSSQEGGQKRHTPTRKDNQQYGLVKKTLGDRRFLVTCSDGVERLCHVPGKYKGKRFWIQVGSVILVNERAYQDDKNDVIYVYTGEDVKFLRRRGELDAFFQGEDDREGGYDDIYEFDDEVEDTGPVRNVSTDYNDITAGISSESDVDIDGL